MRGLGHRCSSQAHQGNGGQNWGTPGTARGNGNRGRGRGGTANMENPRQNHADRGLPLTPRRAREVRPRPLLSLSVALVALARSRDPQHTGGSTRPLSRCAAPPAGGSNAQFAAPPAGGRIAHASSIHAINLAMVLPMNCFSTFWLWVHHCSGVPVLYPHGRCGTPGLSHESPWRILAMGPPPKWVAGP